MIGGAIGVPLFYFYNANAHGPSRARRGSGGAEHLRPLRRSEAGRDLFIRQRSLHAVNPPRDLIPASYNPVWERWGY